MGLWIIQNILYILLAVATLFGFFWINQFSERLNIKWWMALILSICHTLVGVLCVKLFAFLESGDGSGMSLYGAIFFLPVIYFAAAKLTKRKVSDVFDIFTICIIVTLLCARVNCIASGCCFGAMIPGLDGVRFPTRETEIVFYIALYFILCNKVCESKYAGKIYPIYMMAYGVFRFIVEFLRESPNPIIEPFHISHIWSLVSIVIGATVYYILNKSVKNGDINQESDR